MFSNPKFVFSNFSSSLQCGSCSCGAHTVEKATILLHQGDICQYSFFVSKGLLRSYTIDETGKEHIIQFAPENWIISDRSSFYFNEPSELFIDAIEETEIVCVDINFLSYTLSICLMSF